MKPNFHVRPRPNTSRVGELEELKGLMVNQQSIEPERRARGFVPEQLEVQLRIHAAVEITQKHCRELHVHVQAEHEILQCRRRCQRGGHRR
jgi:hypothetical protein